MKISSSIAHAHHLGQRIYSVNQEERVQLGLLRSLSLSNTTDTSALTSTAASSSSGRSIQADPKLVTVVDKLADYVISESNLSTWSYPVPTTPSSSLLSTTNTPVNGDDVGNDTNNHKRPRIREPELDQPGAPIIPLFGILTGQAWMPDTIDSANISDALEGIEVQYDGTTAPVTFWQTLSHACEGSVASSNAILWPNTAAVPRGAVSSGAYALDCEMCETSIGSEITRVTVSDHTHQVVLDTFVKPSHEIIDYRTEHSGINASVLQGVNITLIQVRIAVLRLIAASDILIGHSLDNDLKALRICHMRCIDTSIVYPHPRGYPLRMKLKILAEKYLNMKIQLKHDGHNSADDCQAAMKLALLKAEKGPLFGLAADYDEDGHDMARYPLLGLLPTGCIGRGCFVYTDSTEAKTMRCCEGGMIQGKLLSHDNTGSSSSAVISTHFESTTTPLQPSPELDFYYAQLTYQSASHTHSIIDDLRQRVKGQNYDSSVHPYSLILITGQTSQQGIISAIKQKKACMHVQACATWSPAQEEGLRKMCKEHHICPVSILLE